MSVSDTNKNRGAHGDSSFKLGGMPSSSENPPGFSRGECHNKYYGTTRYEIEAAAYRRMAAFVHAHYDRINGSDMTGEEGWLLGLVSFTETLLADLEDN